MRAIEVNKEFLGFLGTIRLYHTSNRHQGYNRLRCRNFGYARRMHLFSVHPRSPSTDRDAGAKADSTRSSSVRVTITAIKDRI